jgi:hypothetical protein
MSETICQRPPQTSLQLSPAARASLVRIKQQHGISKRHAVERGIFLYENVLNNPASALAQFSKKKGSK